MEVVLGIRRTRRREMGICAVRVRDVEDETSRQVDWCCANLCLPKIVLTRDC